MAKKKRSRARRAKRRVSGNMPSIVSGTRRRKHTKYGTVRKHRRRVKGMSGITGNETVDVLLGAAVGVAVGVAVDKFVPVNDKAKDGIKLVVAGGGLYMGLKKKNSFMTGMGAGLAGNALTTAAKNFGVVQGIENFMQGIGAGSDTMIIEMNGIDNPDTMQGPDQNVPVISGSQDNYMGASDQPSVVSG